MEKSDICIAVIALLASYSTITGMQSCITTKLTSGLVTNCASCGLKEVPYKTDPCTTELLLNSNALRTIREHDLHEFVNLTVLDLSHNHISSLHPFCFRGLFKLQRLNLNHNNLQAMGYNIFPRGIFKDLASLRIFTVAFACSTFEGEYPIDSFLDLQSLEVLSLSFLTNQVIPSGLSELTKLRFLDFFNGNLIAITRKLMDGVRTSAIESIGFRNMPYLKIIEKGAFSNFRRLRAINLACNSALSHNYVVESLGQTVNTSVDTVILDGMSDNNIVGQFNSDHFCTEFWFNVSRLSLRKNNIISMIFKQEWCMPKLTEIVLSYNFPVLWSLESTKEQDWSWLPQLRVLDLSYNSITGSIFRDTYCDSFPVALWYEPSSYFPRNPPLSAPDNYTAKKAYTRNKAHLYLHFPPYLERLYFNHWRTTTSMQLKHNVIIQEGNNMLYFNFSNSMTVTSVDITLQGLPNLQTIDLSYGILEYISPQFFHELRNLRSLNLSHNSFGTRGTDFHNTFSSLHKLENINLSDNHLQTLHGSVIANCTRLRNVILRNNVLQNVHLDITNLTHLELLDLSGNQIATIEESFLSTLNSLQNKHDFRLDLTNNPFVCNCRPIRFVRWIQTTSVGVKDRENLTCTYNGVASPIVNIPLEEYEKTCREKNAWLQFVYASLCLCLVIAIIVVFLVRYHRWYIVYHLTMCTARRKFAADDNEQHQFDAMIVYFAYAESDAEWAACQWISEWVCTQLLRRAEEQWGLRLYISDRDDKPGASKTENFLYGFSISDKIVVCLTPILCSNHQFSKHFNLTHADRKPFSDYIFIIFGNPANLKTPNKVLQRLLEPESPTTHLYWVEGSTLPEQDKFWKKLRYTLIKDANNI